MSEFVEREVVLAVVLVSVVDIEQDVAAADMCSSGLRRDWSQVMTLPAIHAPGNLISGH